MHLHSMCVLVDDLYLPLNCAHEQKHTGVRLIGVANKMQRLQCLWALPNDLKHNEASFLKIFDGFAVLTTRSDTCT